MKIKNPKHIFFAALIILGAAFLSGCAAYVGIRLYVNQFIEDNYHRRVTVWKETSEHIPVGGIVFLGDSHTEYYALDEFFPEFHVYNRGIYGDTTYGVKKRLDESVFNIKPSKVFLLIGANDINKTNDKNEVIAGNIKDIVAQIQNGAPETKIYLQSLYPVNRTGKNSKLTHIYKLNNKRISAINVMLEAFCREEGIAYIDMFSHLIDKDGQLREEFSIEGLHLNAVGYSYVTEKILPYVERID